MDAQADTAVGIKGSKNAKPASLPASALRRVLVKLVELPPQINDDEDEVVDVGALLAVHEKIEALVAEDTNLHGHDAEVITVERVAHVVATYRSQAGSRELKIVSRADRAFRLYHDGKKRAEVMAEIAAQYLPLFKCTVVVLLLLTIVDVGLCSALVALSPSPDTVILCLVALVLMLPVVVLGWMGQSRALHDLANDLDGVETIAQTRLSIFCFSSLFLSFTIVILGFLSLADLERIDATLSREGSYYPNSFASLASRISVDPTANTGTVDSVQETLRSIAIAHGIFAILLFLCSVVAGRKAYQIVTHYEMLQALMRICTAFAVVMGALLTFLGAMGGPRVQPNKLLHVPLPPPLRDPVVSYLDGCIHTCRSRFHDGNRAEHGPDCSVCLSADDRIGRYPNHVPWLPRDER